jgi:hypothetical protein
MGRSIFFGSPEAPSKRLEKQPNKSTSDDVVDYAGNM